MMHGGGERGVRAVEARAAHLAPRRSPTGRPALEAGGLAAACSLLAAATLSAAAAPSTAQGRSAVLARSPAARAAAAPVARAVWVRINGGTTSATQIGDSLGTARTANGILHVVWNRGLSAADATTKIFQTLISPAGAVIGTSTVATGWNSLAGGYALVVMPDKSLRLFVTGQSAPNAPSGMNILSAPPSGQGFTLDRDHVWEVSSQRPRRTSPPR